MKLRIFAIFFAVVLAAAACTTIFISTTKASAQTPPETNLILLSGAAGFSSHTDEFNDDTIVFEKPECHIRLTVVGETPSRLEVFVPDRMLPVVLKYQGLAEDHQFAEDVIECEWIGQRILMNSQEYEDFCAALRGEPRNEWEEYVVDGNLRLELWANYHGFSMSRRYAFDMVWNQADAHGEKPRLILDYNPERIYGISAQYVPGEEVSKLIEHSKFGETVATYKGLTLDRDMLNSIQFWLCTGLPT